MELTREKIEWFRLCMREDCIGEDEEVNALCDLALSALTPQAAIDASKAEASGALPKFGDYVWIEQHRYGGPNEIYQYKVVGQLQSNTWVDVPVHAANGEVMHDSIEPVVRVICCGVCEDRVEKFRVADVRTSAAAPAQPQSISLPDVPPHAEIYVGDGKFALCDWADFDLVKSFNWSLTTRNKSGGLYAQTWDKRDKETRRKITMHSLILPRIDDRVVDHINGNGLDNRRSNLRYATFAQNTYNAKPRGGKSKFIGVSFESESKCWRAHINVDGKKKSLGRYQNEIDAAKAYDMAARQYRGEFARLNNVD